MASCSLAAIRRAARLELGLARTGVVVPSDPWIARGAQTPASTWLERLSQLVFIIRLGLCNTNLTGSAAKLARESITQFRVRFSGRQRCAF